MDIPSRATSRRQSLKQRRRQQIVDAAVGLIAQHGYEATSIDQIAVIADISRATFFNYFATKTEVVDAWVTDRRVHVAAGLSAATGPAINRLRAGLQAVAALYDHDCATSRPMVRAWVRSGGPLQPGADATAALLQAIIEQGQATGEIDPDLNSRNAAQALLDLYLGALYRWSRIDHRDVSTGQDTTMTDRVTAAVQPYLTGIRSGGMVVDQTDRAMQPLKSAPTSTVRSSRAQEGV